MDHAEKRPAEGRRRGGWQVGERLATPAVVFQVVADLTMEYHHVNIGKER